MYFYFYLYHILLSDMKEYYDTIFINYVTDEPQCTMCFWCFLWYHDICFFSYIFIEEVYHLSSLCFQAYIGYKIKKNTSGECPNIEKKGKKNQKEMSQVIKNMFIIIFSRKAYITKSNKRVYWHEISHFDPNPIYEFIFYISFASSFKSQNLNFQFFLFCFRFWKSKIGGKNLNIEHSENFTISIVIQYFNTLNLFYLMAYLY